jgi:flagellar motility protein MotE (MotC chaperone)
MTTATLNSSTASIYKTSAEDVLKGGLNAMTIACETLTKQNDQLNKDINNLKQKLRSAEEKLIINSVEKE